MFEPKCIQTDMASDTMDMRATSIHGHKYAQVFGNKDMFVKAYPIGKKSQAGDALRRFLTDYGAPDLLIVNGSKEQTTPGSKF